MSEGRNLKMRKIIRRGAGLGALLAVLVLVYTGLVLAVYTFPDEWVAGKVDEAIAAINKEVNYWGCYGNYFWHSDYGITDNISDGVIYTRCCETDAAWWTRPCTPNMPVTGTAMPCCCGR